MKIKARKLKICRGKDQKGLQFFFSSHIPVEQQRVRVVHVFKQQFSIFLKLRVGKKMCKNTCNII